MFRSRRVAYKYIYEACESTCCESTLKDNVEHCCWERKINNEEGFGKCWFKKKKMKITSPEKKNWYERSVEVKNELILNFDEPQYKENI